MNWSDIPWNPSSRMLRQFAVLWLLCVGFAAWRLESATVCVVAVSIGLLGVVWPRSMRELFIGLTIVTLPIGWAVSHLLLAALFYLVFTPLGWCFRLFGRDVLGLQRSVDRETYWESRTQVTDVRRYFQPF
jgi:hypothetical protein